MPNRLHLLMVDDPCVDAMIPTRLLESPGVGAVRLERVSSVADALDLLRRHFYDAVLLALRPDATALNTVRNLCSHYPNLAVVVVTAADGDMVGRDAMAAGAQDHLIESHLDAATLAHVLHRAVERQRIDFEQRRASGDLGLLFQDHPYPWLVCDRHTLRIREANRAAVEQYEYNHEELCTKTLLDLCLPQEQESVLAVLRAPDLAAVRRNVSQMTRHGRLLRMALTLQTTLQGGSPALIVLGRDISVEEQAVRTMEQSERRFRKLFQYSKGLICTHDLRGVVLSINPAAAKALGYAQAQLLGRFFVEFMPERHHDGFAKYLRRIANEREDVGAFRLLRADGKSVIWEYHNVLDEDEHGEPYVLGHAQDITDRVLQQRRLHDETIRDPLTGCFNRRALDMIEERIGTDEWSVAVVDLDRFKHINDTQGHARGDEVLASMAMFLRNVCEEDATVVRSGGDEFVIVAGGSAVMRDALQTRIERARQHAPHPFTLGWALRDPGETLADTMKRADEKLYLDRRVRDAGNASGERKP